MSERGKAMSTGKRSRELGSEGGATSGPRALSEEQTTHLEIAGMTCASCVRSVERLLTALPGVLEVSVNLATGDARVTAAPGADLDDQTMISAVEQGGYTASPTGSTVGTQVDMTEVELGVAKTRFLCALLGTIPVAIAMWWGGMSPTSIAIQALGAAYVLAFPGRHYFTTAWGALRVGRTTMDTLIALGSATAFIASGVAVAGGFGEEAPFFFETAAFLITFISFGKWLEIRVRGEARNALRSLLDLTPPTARKLAEGVESVVPAASLQPGDRIVVLPGENIPADGVVRRGTTAVDESVLTGESLPVEKNTWDDVTGGTTNSVGRIEVEVTAIGQQTVLAGLVRMVREAQAHPAPIQRLADRVSGFFVPLVIVLAIVTGTTWILLGADAAKAISFAVAVVVIACPCALGLATPTAILVGCGIALRHGILVKNGAALEELARADLVFLDKTGTLTEGKFTLASIVLAPDGGVDEETLLAMTAALERGSTHPIARSIVETAEARGVPRWKIGDVQETRGLGVSGIVDGQTVLIGRPDFLREAGVEVAEIDSKSLGTQVSVAIEGQYQGTLFWTDAPRTEAGEVVAELRNQGLEVTLLSGDRREVAESIGRRVGIEQVVAEVLPGEKCTKIEEARRAGRTVVMVGDGINDAPALATAQVGIAIGAGADAAKESGAIVLVRSDLRDLLRAQRLARATLGKIRGNLVWAFLYNLIGLPVAAGTFAFAGITLQPEFAGLAMALSSVSVVVNSLLLRRKEDEIFSEVS